VLQLAKVKISASKTAIDCS